MSKSPQCPICHQELDTVQFLLQANEVFSAVGHRVEFPCCGTVFYIETEGVKWWDALKGKPRTKPGHCEHCGVSIEGSKHKVYCSRQCRQAAYYQRRKKFLLSERRKKKGAR